MAKLSFEDVKKITGLHKGRNLVYSELYKKYFMSTMDRQAELDKKAETRWMSNISSPIIYQLVSAVFGMYQDSKVAFEVYRKIKKAKDEELTPEEQKIHDEEVKKTTKISNQIIDLIEYIYDNTDGSEEFDMSVLDAIILGNGFWGIGYEKSEETYEVIDPKTQGKMKISEKNDTPNIYRIVPLNFFTELSAPTQQKAKINIIRKIATAQRINSMYSAYGVKYAEPKERKNEDIIEKKDWNMVLRYLIFNNMPYITTKKNLWWDTENSVANWNGMHTDIFTDNSYEIGKDIHEIYEIHTDETIQVFVDGVDLGIFARLWPRKKKPIYKLSFKDGVNWLYDIWVWYLWYNYHKVVDGFLNMRVDNDRLVGSSPLIVNSDDNYFDGMDFLEQYPGKLIKVKDVNMSIKPLQLQSNWATVANSEVDLLWKTIQDVVGVSWYKMWVQQKVERSAKWVSELVDSADASMKSFINSIAKAKSFIAKYITLLAITYMDKESLIKILGNDDLQTELKIEDLISEYSINFDIQSVSSIRDRQELETMKGIVRDFWGSARPDGTPLLDQEFAFRTIIEKSGMSNDLILTDEEALEYMKEQVKRNAELKTYESSLMPQWEVVPGQELTQKTTNPDGTSNTTTQKTTPVENMPPEWGIVPDFNANAGVQQTIWLPAQPGIQWGSTGAWDTKATNPTWQNWQVF